MNYLLGARLIFAIPSQTEALKSTIPMPRVLADAARPLNLRKRIKSLNMTLPSMARTVSN
jgi:hypothetical protein